MIKILSNRTNLMGLLFVIGLLLNGCVPYYQLSKSEFPQGKNLDMKQLALVQQYQKSATIYDRYTTLAIFDVLWLPDVVREAYVNLNSRKSGKNQTSKDAFLNRQLEENKHWISFYVLADIRQQSNATMNEKNPLWSVYLDLGNDKKIEPELVKETELEPEYIYLFGEKFNSFKTAYLVQFPAKDPNGKFNLNGCNEIKLVISSVDKACELSWNLSKIQESSVNISKSKKKVRRYEDCYWG